uniref:Ge1_WD40 domain-containing protein n=1 Tax=Heterorhabditis bacteriophora TaxID=37862 RepID=A0A1I7WVL6_HETBA
MGMGEPYASTDHLSPSSILEKYTLDGSDNIIRFVNGNNVVLSLESQTEARVRDSARVHTKVISDYKGDVRALSGRFLAVQGDLIAFRFFNENTGEVVRVIDRVSRNRHLIKGFRKSPIDLQYAPHAPLLAVLDSESSLYVYTVANDCQDVVKYINIVNWPEDTSQEPRLVWCPYVPENPSDPSDSCNMLAIYKGRKVFVINLTILKGSSSNSQIDFEEATKVEDAILSVEMDEDVTTVCISPDSTAVAIGTTQGIVSFYIVNGSELKFAHNWDPQLNRPIVGLFFLDDTRNLKNQEPFWRHCLAVGEGGRHMALFECEQWHCLGLLRFDSPLDLTRFDVHVDPQARYINILDPDGANVFFVELRQGQPRFISITQVTFCHPVVSVIPYDIANAEKNESVTDFSLDDDYDPEARNEVTAHYIAIGHKSLLQLDVQLEKSDINSEGMVPIKAECQVEGQKSSTEGPSDLLAVATTNTLQLDKPRLVEQLQEMSEKNNDSKFSIFSLIEKCITEEEFSLREDRLLANISDLIETNRTETINVVRNALNENSVAVENSIQANHKASD